MIWVAGILAALLLLLLVTPLGVRFEYASSGPVVDLRLGPMRIRLYPAEKKTKKESKKRKAKADNFEKVKGTKQGGSIKKFLPLAEDILKFLNVFRGKLRVNYLNAKVTLGGGDPADLAFNYGRVWSAVGNLMPRLEQFLRIRKRDVQINCDFTADTTDIYVDLLLTITVGRLLGVSVAHGVRILKKFIQIINDNKGGVNTHE